MSLRLTFLLLASAVLIHSPAQGLQWEKPIQQFERSPEDKAVETSFRFTNTADRPVTVTSVRTSCGCTAARLEKKTYAPGESGAITARFAFGSRKGNQRKTITVFADDAPQTPTVLDLRVLIEQPLTITPALVFWRTGESNAAKTIRLAAGQRSVNVKRVISSNPRVQAKLETIKPGAEYAIAIQPMDTGARESAEIAVLTDYPPDAPKTYTVHARIK